MQSRRIGSVLAIATFMTSCAILGSGCNPYQPKLEFFQADFNLNGELSPDSSWGSVLLTYTGSEELLYFNLVVNGTYVLQNIPILSELGPGKPHGAIVRFGLGIPEGTDVSTLTYAFSLGTEVAGAAPSMPLNAAVAAENVVLYDGFFNAGDTKNSPAPAPLRIEGDTATTAEFHGVKFPNQECGINECCPAAVSNSLQFLRERHHLDLADEDIDMNAMKAATGWEFGCDKTTWWMSKDEVMREKGIDTKRIDTFDEIFQEIKDGHDVELIMKGHAVVVTGLVLMANGKYMVQLVHDAAQGEPGGQKWPEHIEYNPTTGEFEGAYWALGRDFLYFVSESPSEPGG